MRTLNYIDPFITHSEDWVQTYRIGSHERRNNHVVPLTKKPIIIDEQRVEPVLLIDKKEVIDFRLSHNLNLQRNFNNIKDRQHKNIDEKLPTQAESLLAAAITRAIPSIEQVKLVNSGIKAVNDAIRLAKAFTGKTKILQFEGSIHKHTDQSQHIIIPFNKKDAVEETFAKQGQEIAAILIEPVLSAGVIVPETEYLQFIRDVATKYQTILIFNETISGFRNRLNGAQAYFKVVPDITILGESIAGGLPIGVIGGKQDIISAIDLSSSYSIDEKTALTTLDSLKRLSTPLFYDTLNHRSRDFIHCLKEITTNKGVVVNSFYSMFSIAFSEKEIKSYHDLKASDIKRFERFIHKLRDKDIYFSTSMFEPNFISITHTPQELNRTLEAIYKVL